MSLKLIISSFYQVPIRRTTQNRQTNENAAGVKHVRSSSANGPSRITKPALSGRSALGELTKLAQNRTKVSALLSLSEHVS